LHQVFAPDLAILAQEKAFVNSKFRFYLKKSKNFRRRPGTAADTAPAAAQL